MSFFDDDPFESIMRDFFGQSPARGRRKDAIIEGEEEERVIDFVEDGEKVYLVFELSGYGEKDIIVSVKGKELEIKAQKSSREDIQDYLAEKMHIGVFIRKNLPNFINPKNFSHTVKNGILEVAFSKK